MVQRGLVGIGISNLFAIIILSIIVFANNEKVLNIESSNNYNGMQAIRSVYQQKANAGKANIDTIGSEAVKFSHYRKEAREFRFNKEYSFTVTSSYSYKWHHTLVV